MELHQQICDSEPPMPGNEQKPTSAGTASAQAKGDLEHLPVETVLSQLSVQPDRGLTGAEAANRLASYGPNALIEKQESFAAKLLRHLLVRLPS
jgi:H+-transporting ATPase